MDLKNIKTISWGEKFPRRYFQTEMVFHSRSGVLPWITDIKKDEDNKGYEVTIHFVMSKQEVAKFPPEEIIDESRRIVLIDDQNNKNLLSENPFIIKEIHVNPSKSNIFNKEGNELGKQEVVWRIFIREAD